MHARKTREKKKLELTVLQQRVNGLHDEVTFSVCACVLSARSAMLSSFPRAYHVYNRWYFVFLVGTEITPDCG